MAEIVWVDALDFSQLVKVTVRAEDAREAILEHHGGVDQISSFESRIALGKLSDPMDIRECHRQGCGNDRLQLDTDLPGLLREANGQIAVQNLLVDLAANDGLQAFSNDSV